MRRTRRFLFCLFFAVAAEVWAQVPQISLGTQTLQSDGTTAIPIQISSSGNPPAAIQFDVSYDNTTASIAASAGSSATSASKTLYTHALQPNAIRMILVDVNQNNILDGPVVNFVVTPVQSGGMGPYTITFSNVVAVTANGIDMATSSPGNPGGPGSGGGSPPPFGIVNAASQTAGAIAPGEIVTLYIKGLVPASAAGSDLSVTINGTATPILYADPNQINTVTPFELAGQSSTQVALNYQGMSVAQGTVSVAATAPGVFSANAQGTGQAVLINQDGTSNSASHPASQGSIVALFATGGGVMNPPLTDGVPTPTVAPFAQPVASVQLSLCGVDINPNSLTPAGTPQIPYKGPVPGEIPGILQVNFVVPGCKNTGSAVPLYLFVGGVRSQTGLTFAIQ
jgi:uncharacterized protein (TIGR03437 family)